MIPGVLSAKKGEPMLGNREKGKKDGKNEMLQYQTLHAERKDGYLHQRRVRKLPNCNYPGKG